MRSPHFSAALVIFLAGTVAIAQPGTKSDAKKPPQFAQVVTEKFDAWDADDDGTPNGTDPTPLDPCLPNPNTAACKRNTNAGLRTYLPLIMTNPS